MERMLIISVVAFVVGFLIGLALQKYVEVVGGDNVEKPKYGEYPKYEVTETTYYTKESDSKLGSDKLNSAKGDME